MSQNSKKNSLFAQVTGFMTLANSHRLPQATKEKILQAPEGQVKALQVQVMEVEEFRSQLKEALGEVEVPQEVQEALDKALAEAAQKVVGKLRISKNKGNLTSNIAVAFRHITPCYVEGVQELNEGELDEELLKSLMG